MIESFAVKDFEQKVAVDSALNERAYQDKKWGGAAHDDAQTPEDWAKDITDYLNHERYNFAKRMRKVAGLALAALESEIRKGTAYA